MFAYYPQLNKINQGGTQIEEVAKNIDDESADEHNETINTVMLDDLVPFIPFKKAVMKIDIEGHEHKALSKAEELFNKVEISFIFMEWMFLGKYKHGSEDFDLVNKLLNNFHLRGFLPYKLVATKLKDSDKKEDNMVVWKNPWGTSMLPHSVEMEQLKTDQKHWPQNILWAKKRPVLQNRMS